MLTLCDFVAVCGLDCQNVVLSGGSDNDSRTSRAAFFDASSALELAAGSFSQVRNWIRNGTGDAALAPLQVRVAGEQSTDEASMFEFKQFLVPFDFSEGSQQALEFAVHLARHLHQAKIHLLNVVTDPGTFVADASIPGVLPSFYLDELRTTVQESLAKVEPAHRTESTVLSREVTIGSPVDEIVRHARDRSVDLICVGTHGRTGLARLALGSVAEGLVRHAPCPVLAVRSRMPASSEIAIRRIIAAVDFSEFTPSTVQCAADMARNEGAELDLVHVIEDSSPTHSEWAVPHAVIHDHLQSLRRDAEQKLRQIDQAGLKMKMHVLMGCPFAELVKHASETDADIVIVGTHGRTGIRHWFLGSVAEMVVRKAPCAVLIVRSRSSALQS